jgi:hypothetical protein
MGVSGFDFHDVRNACDRHRGGALDDGPIADLAIRIGSPSFDRTIG